MKVFLGDKVCSNDFGSGRIVAITKQWCVFVDKDGTEFALPWDEIFIEAEPAAHPKSIEKSYDLK